MIEWLYWLAASLAGAGGVLLGIWLADRLNEHLGRS